MSFLDRKSIVQYLPRESRDACGYCKSKNGFNKFGMWAFQLTTEDYQDLIDRGWRRSGQYCYKPSLSDSCCCLYTIRCDATGFRPSRSQKRILKRMRNFLISDEKPRGVLRNTLDSDGVQEIDLAQKVIKFDRDEVRKNAVVFDGISSASNFPRTSASKTNVKLPSRTKGAKELKPSKAKQIRINRKREKLKNLGLSDEEVSRRMTEKKKFPVVKNVEDFLQLPAGPLSHSLEIRLVRSSPASVEFNDTFEDSFALYKKYQISIHKDKPSSLSPQSYRRFLVQSPLIEDNQYGSYHQQYWLDGKLIAVGVIDVLPTCVSSVYFFYDPDYYFLSLGTYGALRELEMVRSLNKTDEKLKFYYMGFYIRSCPKMRYKGAFRPSYLLCPELYTWHPIELCLPKIDLQKYARLNDNPDEAEQIKKVDLKKVLVIHRREIKYAGDVPQVDLDRNCVLQYCTVAGSSAALRIVLQLE